MFTVLFTIEDEQGRDSGNETIGGIVRKMRKRAGLTQKELAKNIGVSQVRISKVERDKARVYSLSVGTLATIAAACGYTQKLEIVKAH